MRDFSITLVVCLTIVTVIFFICYSMAWYNYNVERLYIEHGYTLTVLPGKINTVWIKPKDTHDFEGDDVCTRLIPTPHPMLIPEPKDDKCGSIIVHEFPRGFSPVCSPGICPNDCPDLVRE